MKTYEIRRYRTQLPDAGMSIISIRKYDIYRIDTSLDDDNLQKYSQLSSRLRPALGGIFRMRNLLAPNELRI